MESLRHLTIEETYELADAIIENDKKEIKKELGDVLLHISRSTPITVASEQNTATDQHKGQTQQANTPCLTITADQSSAHYEQSNKKQPDGWHKLIAWPEGIATWGLLLTLGAII